MKTMRTILSILSLSLFFSMSYAEQPAATTTTTSDGYAVQIAVSNTPMPTTCAKFNGLTDVREEICTGEFKYKYTVGWTKTFSEAWTTRTKMRDAGFPDAFVVAYRNGTRWNGKATATPGSTVGSTTSETTTAKGNTVTMTAKKTTTWTETVPSTTTTNPNSTPEGATSPTTVTVARTTNGDVVTTTTKGTTTWNETTPMTNTTPTTTSPTTATATGTNNTTWTAGTTPSTTTTTASTTTAGPRKGLGFTMTETQPTFPGGDDALAHFLDDNLHQAQRSLLVKGVWKVVTVSFVVDKTGKVKDPNIISGLNKQTDADVMRVMKTMPDWKPAMIGSTAIEKQFILPMSFWITENTTQQTGITSETKE